MADEKIEPTKGPTLYAVGYDHQENTEMSEFFRGAGARVTSMAPADFDREEMNRARVAKNKREKNK